MDEANDKMTREETDKIMAESRFKLLKDSHEALSDEVDELSYMVYPLVERVAELNAKVDNMELIKAMALKVEAIAARMYREK